MSTLRRDFLAFTAGAVVSRIVLPVPVARAAPDPAAFSEQVRRAMDIFHRLSPRDQDAWLRFAQRSIDGMPNREAEALMWSELGREPPAWVGVDA